MIFNRAFHALLRTVLPVTARDISNNLKLYRAEIFREMVIQQNGFAANVETGAWALLPGHDVVEVPVSWVNRTAAMGASSFHVLSVVPDYVQLLWRLAHDGRRPGRKAASA
jgi:hypothetical protein